MKIYDLNNVPLVTGAAFVKWHLPSSTAAEHRGRTEKAVIKEHKVVWKYTRLIPLRLVINKNNELQECLINLEVVQDCSIAGRIDKIILGKIDLNLAEYVDEGDTDGEQSVVRRYLMQDSKINSTLRIGVGMRQVDGDREFIAPPLKTAMVFGKITGIVAGEQDGKDEVGNLPSLSTSRDQGEAQDMYRQILAASWISHEGELMADQCIEDIFDGGDGWKPEKNTKSRAWREECHTNSQNLPKFHHARSRSSTSAKLQEIAAMGADPFCSIHEYGSHESLRAGGVDHMIERSLSTSHRPKVVHEVDEFSLTDDLIAWRVRDSVSSEKA